MERMSFGLTEVKFDDGTEAGTFSGYGAVFGNEDSYGDVLVKGCFRDTLREAKKTGVWPAMLLQHGFGWGSEDMTPIGIWTSLAEDDTGLRVEGKLAVETARGKDVYALLKMTPRPALDSMSIGYRAKEYVVGTKPGEPYRTLKKVDLFEVSLVTRAANPQARIDGVKTILPTKREMEDWLVRDAGFSRSQAKAFIAGGYKNLEGARDAATGDQGLTESLNKLAAMIRG